MSGSWPAGTLVQVPSLWEIAQDLQVPAHAVPQQTPCAQMPELHSVPAPQVAPSGFLPQLPPTHELPGMQSESLAQVVLHCALSPHMNGVQGALVGSMHLPAPSQRAAAVNVEPVQAAAMQIVPGEYTAQAPVPSHSPVFLHDEGPSSLQSSRGSVPRSATTHVPTCPGAAQVRQTPEHSVAQQTPSAQNPVSHWLPSVQPWPTATEPVSRGPSSRSPAMSVRSAGASPPSVATGTSAPPSPLPLSLL
jgi:hypothetical protein